MMKRILRTLIYPRLSKFTIRTLIKRHIIQSPLLPILILLALAVPAFAAPSLSDYLPANNSYFGRGNVNFYVNATTSQSLNLVKVYMISEDAYLAGESWDTYTMTCAGGPEDR